MLKKLTLFVVAVLLTAAPVFPVFAQDYGLSETAGSKGAGYSTGDTVYSLIGKIVSTFLAAIAIVFFIMALFSGLRWMTARGNEEMATKAKETLEAAVLGLIIIVISYALTRFIFGQLVG